MKLSITAIHEACHATSALALGRTLVGATVRPQGIYLGQTVWMTPTASNATHRDRVADSIIVAGGIVGEALFAPESDRAGKEDDVAHLRRKLSFVGRERIVFAVEYVGRAAQKILEENVEAVLEIATALDSVLDASEAGPYLRLMGRSATTQAAREHADRALHMACLFIGVKGDPAPASVLPFRQPPRTSSRTVAEIFSDRHGRAPSIPSSTAAGGNWFAQMRDMKAEGRIQYGIVASPNEANSPVLTSDVPSSHS